MQVRKHCIQSTFLSVGSIVVVVVASIVYFVFLCVWPILLTVAFTVDIIAYMFCLIISLGLCFWFLPFVFTFLSVFLLLAVSFLYLAVIVIAVFGMLVGWIIMAVLCLIGQSKHDEMWPKIPLLGGLAVRFYNLLADRNIVKE